jgi:hypothetical protein
MQISTTEEVPMEGRPVLTRGELFFLPQGDPGDEKGVSDFMS